MSVTVPGEVTVLELQMEEPAGSPGFLQTGGAGGAELPKPNLALTPIGLVSWASSA